MAYTPDPILGAQIMSALNISADELALPRNLSRFREVYDYFKDYPSADRKILALTAGKSGDKLDVVWTWVALHRKKETIISELSPGDFVEEVAKDIAKKQLPKESRKKIRSDIDELRKKKAEDEQYKQNVDKSVDKLKLDRIDESLKQLDEVDAILDSI